MSRQSCCTNKVTIRPVRLPPVVSRGHVYKRVLERLRNGPSDQHELEPKAKRKQYDCCNATPIRAKAPPVNCVPLSHTNALTNLSGGSQTSASILPIPSIQLEEKANNTLVDTVAGLTADTSLVEHLLCFGDSSRYNEITILLSRTGGGGGAPISDGRAGLPEELLVGGGAVSNNGCIAISDDDDGSTIKSILAAAHNIVCYDAHGVFVHIYSKYHLSLIGQTVSLFDAKIAGYLLSPSDPPDSMESLLERCTTGPDHVKSKTNNRMQDLSRLKIYLQNKLKEHSLSCVFDIEMKVAPIVAGMEYYGVQVDTPQLITYLDSLKSVVKSLEVKAREVVGHSVSLASTTQLREVLFTELCLDRKCSQTLQLTSVSKVTSTSEAVLMQLAGFHQLPRIILEYRQCMKMKGFVESLLSYTSTDRLLRPKWLSDRTSTGRLASSNPNIQAFPKHCYSYELPGIIKPTLLNINIRGTIISRPGTSFVMLDFRSIELRLLSHFSNDESLSSIISAATGVDVFVSLASQWLGMNPDNVTGKERERVKRVVYAVIYGVGKERLAELIQSSPSTAQDLVKSFLRTYPKVNIFMQKTVEYCRRNKFCVSLCGRKRWFPLIGSSDYHVKTAAERQAINFVIQGSAADVCKITMIKMNESLCRISSGTKLLVQIHDELLYEVPDEDVPLVSHQLKEIAESPNLLEGYCQPLRVPLAVRISTGKNWS